MTYARRSSPGRLRGALAGCLAALAGAGCTTAILPVGECATHLECREAFGYGSVCGDQGLCEAVEMHPRCDGSEPDDLRFPIPMGETWMMATLFGRTDAHVARYQAAELAVTQANASPAFDLPFSIIHCDYDDVGDGLDQAGAVTELSEWLGDQVGVPVILGPAASSLAGVAYQTTSVPHGTLVVSPSATSVDLTNVDGLTSTDAAPGLFWRTAPPDDAQAVAIVQDMSTRFDPDGLTAFRRAPTERLAILYQTGAYGQGLATTVAGFFADGGLQADLYPFEDPTLIGGITAAVAETDAQEVLFISSNAEDYSAFLLGAAGIAWYADKPIFVTDGGRTTDILDPAIQSLYPNLRGSVPALPEGVVFNAFNASYRGRYGGQDAADHSFVAHSFDGAWLAMYGHAWATQDPAGVTGIGIAKGFRKITAGPEYSIQDNPNSVVSTLKGGGTVDLTGASGPLAYDLTTGELAAVIEIFVVNAAGDNFERVYVTE